MSTTTLLTIKDWILKVIWNTEDEKTEFSKNNWEYRLTTASGQFTIIDYDKDKARPYVKALLAKVNHLREVKMLWFSLGISILMLLISIFCYVLILIRIGGVDKRISEISIPTKTVQTATPIPKNSVSTIKNDRFEDFATDSVESTWSTVKPNNRLIR